MLIIKEIISIFVKVALTGEITKFWHLSKAEIFFTERKKSCH